MTRSSTIRWDDFDKPADIFARLAEKYSLAVEGAEMIPHDLWVGAVIPEATPIEALSLVLAQFELTFAWTDRGEAIRLESMPERVVIEQGHLPPRGKSAAAALADWKEKLPDLEARVEAGKIVVSGTVEIQEMIDRLRRGGTLPDKKACAARRSAAQTAAVRALHIEDAEYAGERPAQGTGDPGPRKTGIRVR